ncbi:unnamed protein product [Symbiodinium necroappetens]|uniref:Uncharacterized protein n=1 Tax=Symbiodinium necroappetens TaxID=1628268 RepID=A0A812ZRK8_9DINO|nr:unnamed protein product [Symbiodinium necroappetens]
MEGFAIPALVSAVAFAATSSGLLHPPASVALPFIACTSRDFTAVGGLAALWLCLRVFLQGDLTLHFLKVSRTLHQPRPEYAGFEKHEDCRFGCGASQQGSNTMCVGSFFQGRVVAEL